MTLTKLVSCKEKLKQPKQFEGNIFTIYSTKKATVEKADTLTFDTELMLTLPDKIKGILNYKIYWTAYSKYHRACQTKALDHTTQQMLV